ncbi:MAG: hypothetical protein IV097_16375 [Burkholderiaceae bacterium]|nr:hypothetical protein [Burkholderiaceae bacterium]
MQTMKCLDAKKLLALACLASSVLAGQQALASVALNDNPELLFVMWDPVAKVSYTKDLGMLANTFWITGQQDAGSQTLIDLKSAADANLAEFLKASTVVANQRWALFAVDSGPTLAPGDTRLFTTLKQGNAEGEVNPNWTDMTTMERGSLLFVAREMPNRLMGSLNFPKPQDRAFNTHGASSGYDATINGSSFDNSSSAGYFAGRSGFSARGNLNADGDAYAGIFSVSNEVGRSSWFYFLTNPQEGGVDSVAVDEFDNLGGNGYWGFAYKSAGTYLLSYTMPAYDPTAKATSAEGRTRLSLTDYAAGFSSRAVAAPAGEFVSAAAVSAVPEPATWGHLVLGLALLGGLMGRNRSRKP